MKRPKINKKEAGVGPFFFLKKKIILMPLLIETCAIKILAIIH